MRNMSKIYKEKRRSLLMICVMIEREAKHNWKLIWNNMRRKWKVKCWCNMTIWTERNKITLNVISKELKAWNLVDATTVAAAQMHSRDQ